MILITFMKKDPNPFTQILPAIGQVLASSIPQNQPLVAGVDGTPATDIELDASNSPTLR